MTLPKTTRLGPREVALTVRLSKQALSELKKLAKDHGMSQADVIEHLVHMEFQTVQKTNNRTKQKK